MHNPIIGTSHFGNVYKRKIHVWMRQNSNITESEHKEGLIYLLSTNAYRTCAQAVQAAKEKHPEFEFKANFARD